MKTIILKAMHQSARRYSKGIPRFEHEWQEMMSIEKQAEYIALSLEELGYIITKANNNIPLDKLFGGFVEGEITTMEGE